MKEGGEVQQQWQSGAERDPTKRERHCVNASVLLLQSGLRTRTSA